MERIKVHDGREHPPTEQRLYFEVTFEQEQAVAGAGLGGAGNQGREQGVSAAFVFTDPWTPALDVHFESGGKC